MKYDKSQLSKLLETIYSAYNKKEYIHPDPLEFLEKYPDLKDREIAALVASSLAYGRVDQILKHVGLVFEIMHCLSKSTSKIVDLDSNGSAIRVADLDSNKLTLNDYITQRADKDIFKDFENFKYRFTNSGHIASFLIGIKSVIKEYGSLKNCFLSSITDQDKNIIPALTLFVKQITKKGNCGNLAPNPEKGSACKRNALFLRWLIRKDDVDPGGWEEISPSMLIVPLDTHMLHAGRILGFTNKKQADMKTALEITEGFRQVSPNDPVKYDFCLTRFGIHPDMNFSELESIVKTKLQK